MTTTPATATDLPLLELKRATRLPPPEERRAIRERAGVSRRELAKELGVSGTAIAWWERADGFTPRPAQALAYRRLLEELRLLAEEDSMRRSDAPAEVVA